MPADFSNYVDMVPEDISAGDIYLGAIELARLTLPELKIRQGTPEDALLQAAAYMNFLAVSQINRIPPRLMEGIGRLMGVAKDEGTRATIPVTITLNQDTGIDLPTGTVFYHTIKVADKDQQFNYQLTSDIAIADFSGSPATVTATLTSRTVGVHPTLLAGATFSTQRVHFEIDSTVATSGFENGGNPEHPLEYLSRATTHLRGLSSALAKASQVKASLITTFEYLRRVKVYDLTDSAGTYPRLIPVGSPLTPVDDVGRMTVFTYGNNRQLTTAEKTEVAKHASDRVMAGMVVGVLDADLIDIDVTVTATYDDTYDTTTMTTLVKNAIMGYLSPIGFTGTVGPSGSEGITQSDVAKVVQTIPGILYVNSVTFADCSHSTSSSGADHTTLYNIASGNVNFKAKGLLPKVTDHQVGDPATGLIVTLTAVTVS